MEELSDYEWLSKMNLCHRCRRAEPAPGRKYCFDCLEKNRAACRKWRDRNKEYDRNYNSRKRQLYREHIQNGICIRCSKPATHGRYCYEHLIVEKRKNEQRKRKNLERGLIPEIRKESGLCKWCGSPAIPGLQCCEKHHEILKEAARKGREARMFDGYDDSWIWTKRQSYGKEGTTGRI